MNYNKQEQETKKQKTFQMVSALLESKLIKYTTIISATNTRKQKVP